MQIQDPILPLKWNQQDRHNLTLYILTTSAFVTTKWMSVTVKYYGHQSSILTLITESGSWENSDTWVLVNTEKVKKINKGCKSKSVYLKILTVLWKYTDLLPHPLISLLYVLCMVFLFLSFLFCSCSTQCGPQVSMIRFGTTSI